jgi:glycosyltransferase involved in cell wall biosynthesis
LKTFKCFGWGGETGQIQRIRQGFEQLGLVETEFAPDLIFSNDVGSHPAAIGMKKAYPESKLILNVLDIPEFLLPHGYSLDNARELLSYADSVTAISKHTQRQVKKFFGLDSALIYNPIMSVELTASDKNVRFLHVGRRYDRVKRYDLVQELFRGDGLNPSELVEIGPDHGNIGSYVGIVNEKELSEYYSAADFCFMPSENEGLLLPCLEAMKCGCIPVIHHNLTTKEELLPQEIFSEYDYTETNKKTLLNFVRTVDISHLSEKLMDYFETEHKNKFSPVGVAKRILEVV